jgi:mono/diheme cytochrome c family protein
MFFLTLSSFNLLGQEEGTAAAAESSAESPAEVNLDEGKALFRSQCASCHNKNMKDDLTGPALGGTQERWADYPKEDLYSWIRNSQKMIADGHPRANEVWDEWKPTVMNNFLNLTDQEITNILGYIEGVYEGTYPPKAAGEAVAVAESTEGDGSSNTFLFITLALILLVLSYVLARIVSVLNAIAQAKATGTVPDQKSIWQVLTSKSVIGLLVFVLVVVGGYTTVNNAINLGRQQGYSPQQPIKFSHETHAGLHKIDCQYCHDGARRSKHSVIPAANTCMNCHRAIKNGSKYGTQELTKVFASIGYNPMNDSYIEGYEDMSNEELSEIYKKWIEQEYVKDNELDIIDEEGKLVRDDQWSAIVSSLTNDQKQSVAGPIEWVRVHNLPDHVYFNHAQHVTSGEVECEQCHGAVEEMEVLAQYAPLSMGWCINCHRESEVKGFDDNPYYHKEFERYHKELQNGEREKVTVEDIGGLECQKCHY